MAPFALVLTGLLLAGVTDAQTESRLYVATTTAVDAGERGNIPGGTVPSLGGLVGIRLTPAWSLEVEVERGFRTTTVGTGESVISSFPPSPNPTREEIERYGIRTFSDRRQTAGAGWSVLSAWRSREPGRVNAALFAGVSSRIYTAHLVRTTTFVSPLITLPPTYTLPDETSSRRMVAGGLTVGAAVLVRITPRLTLAPEFRVTCGLITDDPYRVFRSGVRAVWSF